MSSTRRLIAPFVFAVLLASLSVAGSLGTSRSTAQAADTGPSFAHVFVLILENQRYEDIVGGKDAPFINSVLEKSQASATRFYSPLHNSPGDYYALASGRSYTKGDGGDWGGTCLPSPTCSTDDPSVFQQLNEAGKSWRTYSEDQDTNCQLRNAKKYWAGHNPALFYRNLGPNGYVTTGNGSCVTSDVPYTKLAGDISSNSLPDLAFLIPNNCHNMHDPCPPVSNEIKQGDAWLSQQLAGDATVRGGLIKWAQTHDTLIVVTFDESHFSDGQTCCPYAQSGGGGHIPTWVIGPPDKVRAGGFKSNLEYNLYSILRTVEQNWNLPLLGHAADPTVFDLTDFLPSRIELDHGGGVAGSTATLTGKDFAPGENVDVVWNCQKASCPDGRVITTLAADGQGALRASISIPSDGAGTHALGARGASSGLFGYAPFTIRPPLAVAPTSGAHADQVQIGGAGYGPNETVTLYWNCPSAPCREATPIGSVKADPYGNFDNATVIIPPTAKKGSFAIRGVGDESGTSQATTFQVTESLTISPDEGISSSTIEVSGKSFNANERIRLLWDCKAAGCGSNVVLGTALADAAGDFRGVKVAIPSGVDDGNFAIGAQGATIYSFARDWFKVKQPLSAFPPTGSPGRTVSVSAAGFAGDEEVRIFWNCTQKGCPKGTALGSSLTDDNGELSAVQIALPPGVPGGVYHLGAVGTASGKFATTTFKVTPQITTSPARGANGWTATISGAGFGPAEQVAIMWDCDGTCQGNDAVAQATTDRNGMFGGVKLQVPLLADIGPHPITAEAKTTGAAAVSSFSVESWLTVSPKKGAAGWNATLTGSGFAPNEQIALIWDCAEAACSPSDVLRSINADGKGLFEAKVVIPSEASLGDHELGALGEKTKSFAHGTITIIPGVAGRASGDITIAVAGFTVRFPPQVPIGAVGVLALGLAGRAILRRRRRPT